MNEAIVFTIQHLSPLEGSLTRLNLRFSFFPHISNPDQYLENSRQQFSTIGSPK